jgi:hypothetical protein
VKVSYDEMLFDVLVLKKGIFECEKHGSVALFVTVQRSVFFSARNRETCSSCGIDVKFSYLKWAVHVQCAKKSIVYFF